MPYTSYPWAISPATDKSRQAADVCDNHNDWRGSENNDSSTSHCRTLRQITLRSHHVRALSLPAVDKRVIRTTRERLRMSRAAFAHSLGVNPRTLERWEQGRSKPNDQAAALILLVRKYPDTLSRLESLAATG